MNVKSNIYVNFVSILVISLVVGLRKERKSHAQPLEHKLLSLC